MQKWSQVAKQTKKNMQQFAKFHVNFLLYAVRTKYFIHLYVCLVSNSI